jgi:hypothetical protein
MNLLPEPLRDNLKKVFSILGKFAFSALILSACHDETDLGQIVSWTDLSDKYDLKPLYTFDYDPTYKVFVLGYYDRYEVRDENFKIKERAFLSYTPQAVLYTKDSVYTSSSGHFFKTADEEVIIVDFTDNIVLFNPVTKVKTLLYASSGEEGFNDFAENDQYYVFSAYSKTSCILIEKSTNKVLTFADWFNENGVVGAYNVVLDNQGDIVLSSFSSKHVQFKGGKWMDYYPEKLKYYQSIRFIDSRNYAWVTGSDNGNFKLFDINKSQFILTNPESLSGYYFGFKIREHSNGDMIVLSGNILSTTYELIQVHLN